MNINKKLQDIQKEIMQIRRLKCNIQIDSF